jgi:hypothetical protein
MPFKKGLFKGPLIVPEIQLVRLAGKPQFLFVRRILKCAFKMALLFGRKPRKFLCHRLVSDGNDQAVDPYEITFSHRECTL